MPASPTHLNVSRPLIIPCLSLSCCPNTHRRFYITASSHPSHHRILKIDRTTPETLTVTEDHASYDAKELEGVLRMVDDGNRSAGGLEKVLDFQ